MRRVLLGLAVTLGLVLPAFGQDVVSLPPPTSAGASAAGDSSAADDTSSASAPEEPLPCNGRTITIARMQWPSAELLAEIHARLIKRNFGCDVQVVPGDLGATAQSMGANGQPAVAPELWVSRVADVWNTALKGEQVREAGTSYSDTVFEGWFIPDYVAAAHPDIKSVLDLKTAWKVFAGSGRKGKFISCPPDWACSVINRNLMRANGLSDLFEIVEPANRFELDTLISEAESRKEPILFYYWQPNAVLSQFSFKPIVLGPYNKDAFACMGQAVCSDPKPTGFAPDQVVVALAQWVYTDAPEVAAYFQRAHMPFSEMNTLLQNLNEPGATVEGVADAFVAARTAVWQGWVGGKAGAQ
jgi:glycine betaine/proline transport system substrate-binding protein